MVNGDMLGVMMMMMMMMWRVRCLVVSLFCTGGWDQIKRAVDIIREISRIAVDNVLDGDHFLGFLFAEHLLGSAFASRMPCWSK